VFEDVKPERTRAQQLLDLTDRELNRYSICRALSEADGFERDVSDELARRLKRPAQPDKRLIPTGILGSRALELYANRGERALLDTATATKGAELKFTEPGEFPVIELLRKVAVVAALGATIVPGLRGDVSLPRQTGTVTGAWVPESPTADVSPSNPTLDGVPLQPKMLTALTSYSRKLLRQAAKAVDAWVALDMIKAFGVELDRAAINGAGANNEPRGVLNTSGIGSVTLGANGGVPSYDTFVDMEFTMGAAHADLGALGWITTSKTRQRMRKSAQISAATGVPVWSRGQVLDYTARASENVPQNLTKGTATACHGILFGNWADVLMADWGAIEVLTDPYALKRRADIEVTSYWLVDLNVRHAASFVACKDALP